eukprot:8955_1
MSSVLNCALYVIWISMQVTFTRGCSYGGISNTTATNCLLTCYDNYYLTGMTISNLSTLSFDELRALKYICPSIQTAINEYGSASCSSLSDLVWPSQCGCPFCACQQAENITDYHEHEYYMKKTCTNCTCTTVNAKGDQGWSCKAPSETESGAYMVSNAEEWNHFTCDEGITCSPMNPSDQSIYQPGDVWWEDISYDSSCQTFCYCQYDGTPYCETSYADIVTSAHPGLRDAYFDSNNCYETRGCAREPSLLDRDTSLSYCTCPKCMCPSGKVSGDTEYIEYTETDTMPHITNMIRTDFHSGTGMMTSYCMECTCVGSPLYRECDDIHSDHSLFPSYTSGTETCAPTVSATCFSGESKNTSGLVSKSCYGDDTYCGWTWTQYWSDIEDRYEYGCQSRMFCEAFQISDGACFEIDLAYTAMIMLHGRGGCANEEHFMYTGLYSGVNTQEYHMCCSGTNCNDQDIVLDASACPYHVEINTWYESYHDCLYGDTSPYQTWMCEPDNGFTCQDVQSIGNWLFGCDCTAIGYLYTRVGTDGQASFAQQMSARLTQLDEWNTLFDCGLTFTCDLSTAQLSVNGELQSNSPTRPITAQPTLSTPSPTESTGNPSQVPTQVPTLDTASPTGNPSQVPTQVTGVPITAAPTEVTQGCSYGAISNTTATNCLLTCYDNYYVTGMAISDLSTLSFDELRALKYICPSIQTAINEYGSASCSSLSDLVWPSQCGCPFCACQQAENITDYHEHEYYMKKTCTNCTCTTVNAKGDQGWSCKVPSETTGSGAYMISKAEEWNHFTAPTTGTAAPTSVPTEITSVPTRLTASPTRVSVSPTSVSSPPTAVSLSPTGESISPTGVSSSPTEVSASPTDVSASPTSVTPSPSTVLSPTCAPDDECNEAECAGECEVVNNCSVCVGSSFANTYSIGVAVWIGFVIYLLQFLF